MLTQGVLNLPWWAIVLATLGMTHVTIAAVTIFLHRHQAHRALELSAPVSHFFRFWLWLTTGMITREWVAVHRKHHAACEGPEDPHSPVQYGLSTVMLKGTELYRESTEDLEIMRKYGHGTPGDWIEQNLYSRYNGLGVVFMLLIDLALFGVIGLTVWAIQMIWIPFFAAGVINGMGHAIGYRNFETTDASRNIVPWGILIGGEELHNNHHAYASSARLSSRPFEFDIGWFYIRILSSLRLATIRKVPPIVITVPEKTMPDMETLRAVVQNRLDVMSQYAGKVLKQVHAAEMDKLVGAERERFRRVRRLLVGESARMSQEARDRLQLILGQNQTLATVYRFREDLQTIWALRSQNQDKLLSALQEWCRQAERSGIKALQDFAAYLRGYALAPAVQ